MACWDCVEVKNVRNIKWEREKKKKNNIVSHLYKHIQYIESSCRHHHIWESLILCCFYFTLFRNGYNTWSNCILCNNLFFVHTASRTVDLARSSIDEMRVRFGQYWIDLKTLFDNLDNYDFLKKSALSLELRCYKLKKIINNYMTRSIK